MGAGLLCFWVRIKTATLRAVRWAFPLATLRISSSMAWGPNLHGKQCHKVAKASEGKSSNRRGLTRTTFSKESRLPRNTSRRETDCHHEQHQCLPRVKLVQSTVANARFIRCA